MPLHIAIDGPVAAGKGTVARLLASRLGFLYVDTGAMYRTTALLAKQNGVDWNDETKLVELLGKHTITLRNPVENEKDGRQITVLLDGNDVSWAIRTAEMSKGSSVVSQFAGVRRALVEQQRSLAKTTDVVMEGRDITFRVLPDAQLKIYLDANVAVRAERRHQELLARGVDMTFEQILRETKERDERDMHRAVDPLRIVEDAWVLDTTHMTIEEVVDTIEQKIRSLKS